MERTNKKTAWKLATAATLGLAALTVACAKDGGSLGGYTTAYACDNGRTFTASNSYNHDEMTVKIDQGTSYTLPLKDQQGSQQIYQGVTNGARLAIGGDNASLTVLNGGEFSGCRAEK